MNGRAPTSETEGIMRDTQLHRDSTRKSSRNGKRILFVLPNSEEFGGLEKHLLQLLERLLERDLQISIVCFGPDIFTEHFSLACLDFLGTSSVQGRTNNSARLDEAFSGSSA